MQISGLIRWNKYALLRVYLGKGGAYAKAAMVRGALGNSLSSQHSTLIIG